MKHILLFLISILFSCVITAQENNGQYDVNKHCKELLGHFQQIDARKAEIKQKAKKLYEDSAQQQLFNSELDSIMVLCQRILNEAPSAYEIAEAEQRDSYVTSAIKNVQEFLNKSYDEFFNKTVDSKSGQIAYDVSTVHLTKDYLANVLDAYIAILPSNYSSLSKILSTESTENTTDEGSTQEQEKEALLKQFSTIDLLLIGIIVLLLILLILMYININSLSTRIRKCKYAIKEISENQVTSNPNIETRIHSLEQKINNLSYSQSGKKSNISVESRTGLDLLTVRTEIKSALAIELGNFKKEIEDKLKNLSYTSNSLQQEISGQSEIKETKETKETNKVTQPKPNVTPLFAQLQSDGTFRVYDNDNRNSFYLIFPSSNGASTGTFTLKDMDEATLLSAIEGRAQLLDPACVTIKTELKPRKIEVNEQGSVSKQGNIWRIESQAKISLVE